MITHVLACGARALEPPPRDLDGRGLRPALVDGRAGALAEHDQLLDGRRALGVARDERDRARVLLREQRASFATAVVLPEPCRPATRITVGGRDANAIPGASRRPSSP